MLVARLALASVDPYGRHVETVVHLADVVVHVTDHLQHNNGGCCTLSVTPAVNNSVRPTHVTYEVLIPLTNEYTPPTQNDPQP